MNELSDSISLIVDTVDDINGIKSTYVTEPRLLFLKSITKILSDFSKFYTGLNLMNKVIVDLKK